MPRIYLLFANGHVTSQDVEHSVLVRPGQSGALPIAFDCPTFFELKVLWIMRLSGYATHLIVPLHLAAGSLFGLLPASPYDAAYYSLYSVIVLMLVLTLVIYGMLVQHQRPPVALIWVQCGAALLATAVPFYCLNFSAVWHILMYPLFLGGSLFACLLVGNIVLLATRN